jgi:hypothetical protein
MCLILTIEYRDMILYAPKITEKGLAKYLDHAFEHKFNKLFKTKECAIKYALKWLDFEYSQEHARIPKDLEISCDEFILIENI